MKPSIPQAPSPASSGGRSMRVPRSASRSIGVKPQKITAKSLDSAFVEESPSNPSVSSPDPGIPAGDSPEKSAIPRRSVQSESSGSSEADPLGAVAKAKEEEESEEAESSEVSPALGIAVALETGEIAKDKAKEREADPESLIFRSKVRIAMLSYLVLLVAMTNLLLALAICSDREPPRYPGVPPS